MTQQFHQRLQVLQPTNVGLFDVIRRFLDKACLMCDALLGLPSLTVSLTGTHERSSAVKSLPSLHIMIGVPLDTCYGPDHLLLHRHSQLRQASTARML